MCNGLDSGVLRGSSLIGRYSGIFFECVVTVSLEKMVIEVHMAGDAQGSLTVNLINLELLEKKS